MDPCWLTDKKLGDQVHFVLIFLHCLLMYASEWNPPGLFDSLVTYSHL